jgi:type IV pilus assembly protein PilW
MRQRRRNRGISTIEVMAGISLGLVVVAGIYSFQRTQLKALGTQTVYSASQGITRGAIDVMARELRMACYDPASALPAPPGGCAGGQREGIVSATPTSIRFQRDLNGDGVFTGAGEDITYDVSSGSLRRTDGGGAPVAIANNVVGFSLRYFTNDNPPVELVPGGSPSTLSQCNRDLVAKVIIVVQGDISNHNGMGDLYSTVATEVAIRNRAVGNI